VEVPQYIPLERYLEQDVPVLDQGQEGACTGFGLATIAHFLLRTRQVTSDTTDVSPRMLYEMAKRYDEWQGEGYEGSSARGAMKGWHKHGVCSNDCWPYTAGANDPNLTAERITDAANRPLGAYFRVNHRDLVAMHAALAEVGILYVTARVHAGWENVGDDGTITRSDTILGGHAFAIVAYDSTGFWLQNSWGTGWAKQGLAHITYPDWLANGTDAWVARLGVPLRLTDTAAQAVLRSAVGKQEQSAYHRLRSHIVSIGNQGLLKPTGTYGTTPADIEEIATDIATTLEDWDNRNLLLYAHGGLVPEDSAVQKVADNTPALMKNQVYPLSFIWHTDYWTTIRNILADCLKRRQVEGGRVTGAMDFLLDRIDDSLEILARAMTGKAAWSEMKENAELASAGPQGGALQTLQHVVRLAHHIEGLDLHLVGHSAGSIFHAPIVQLLTAPQGKKIAKGPAKGLAGFGLTLKTCTLWAPACTMDLFHTCYRPAIQSGAIRQFNLYTLTDAAERDDNCARLYHKSLLYLVSNAFEDNPRPFFSQDGTPILGMAKFIRKDRVIQKLIREGKINWIRAPQANGDAQSGSTSHGGFDDDTQTLRSTLAHILGKSKKAMAEPFAYTRSAAGLKDLRENLNSAAR
jgi:hypothetical protein